MSCFMESAGTKCCLRGFSRYWVIRSKHRGHVSEFMAHSCETLPEAELYVTNRELFLARNRHRLRRSHLSLTCLHQTGLLAPVTTPHPSNLKPRTSWFSSTIRITLTPIWCLWYKIRLSDFIRKPCIYQCKYNAAPDGFSLGFSNFYLSILISSLRANN